MLKRDCYRAALAAKGYVRVHGTKTKKYEVYRSETACYFLGPSGAVLWGPSECLGYAHTATEDFKKALLAEGYKILRSPVSWDVTSRIIAYENGSLCQSEVFELFQQLLDTGLAWKLQGSYGRMTQTLLNEGFITQKKAP